MVAFAVLPMVMSLAACSDDDNQEGAEACQAAIEVQQSLDALLTMDPEAGAEVLRPAVAAVQREFDDLDELAGTNFRNQLDELGAQLDELRDEVADNGDDIADEMDDAKDAWGDLVDAVHAAASQCDVSSRIG